MSENHCDDIHPWSNRVGMAAPPAPEPTTTTTTQTTTTTLNECTGGCQCDPWMWRHPDGHCVELDECPGQCGENEEYKCAVCTGQFELLNTTFKLN